MADVQTDLQAMIDFRARLTRFNKELGDDYRNITAAWRSLGDVWRDNKYTELGEALTEVGQGIDRYLAATEGHDAYMRRLIEAIIAFKEVR